MPDAAEEEALSFAASREAISAFMDASQDAAVSWGPPPEPPVVTSSLHCTTAVVPLTLSLISVGCGSNRIGPFTVVG